MTDTIIFDAGGVLCCPRMGSWLTTNRLYEIVSDRLGDEDKLREAMEIESKIYLDESLPIADEDMEFIVRRNYFAALSKRLGWELSEREKDVLARDMTENDARYDFYEDTRSALDYISGKYTIGLLSDAMPSIRRVFMNAGLMDMIDASVISCDIGATKPDKRMYEAIMDKLEAERSRCVFIDDREANVRGAIDCGMQGIQLLRGSQSDYEGLKADTLFDAIRLIEQMK